VRISHSLAFAAAFAALAACGQRERPLPGERLDLRALETPGIAAPLDARDAAAAPGATQVATAAAVRSPVPPNRVVPVALPAATVNANWTHRNGSATHRTRHPALSPAPQRLWSTSIGSGNTRRARITADPIVADGRIFTLDSQATVGATSLAGQPLWRRDISPASDRATDASGGALAYGAGRLFAVTSFGRLVALDPATGAELWSQRLDAAATGAPTVVGDLVYVAARDSRGWAVQVDTGRIAWELPATPTPSVMTGGAGPAVTDRLAIFPFGSGEVVAALRQGGIRIWSANIAGQRRGRVYATVTDITGDPVVDGDRVYVGNQSGRVAALNLASGERIWTATEGAYSPVWPEGGSLFLVSDQAELVRLDAATGARIWGAELPYFEAQRLRRLKAVTAHYGPVVAGGRVWVASGDGALRGFAPESGALVHQVTLPGGAASNPAVAGGVLYVLSANGQLHAFR
jgi:outer membrane protein assembly factor BamB